MDLANFDEFKNAMERLHRETEAFSRRMRGERRRFARQRKGAGPPSPQELVKWAEGLDKESGELLKLSRAKQSLLLRRKRAVARAQ
jgi:hypothetical protein